VSVPRSSSGRARDAVVPVPVDPVPEVADAGVVVAFPARLPPVLVHPRAAAELTEERAGRSAEPAEADDHGD
jgi:hypothetical protein